VAHRRTRIRRGRLVAAAAGVALVIAVLVAVLSGGGTPRAPAAGVASAARSGDPFAYLPARASDLAARATAGDGHPLFVKSPGGAYATARRVAALQGLIDRAAAGTGIDPATLAGIVYLESAGVPDAIAGGDPANAAGLTQIEPATGTELLGMSINLNRSRALTRALNVAHGRAQIARLERERERADDRFDPLKALRGTVRYLQLAQQRFGRQDLAIESYHMGIGNLANVLAAYDGGRAVPYVQLYFDTAPDRHGSAYRMLSSFGDDSWTYYWRVLAAEQIMKLYRSDPAALRRLSSLQSGAGSAALVLHPPDRTPSLADPGAVASAYASHQLVRLPRNQASLGLAYDPGIGSYASKLGVSPALYHGLQPVALQLLIELAGRVRSLSGGARPLIVSSAVADQRYQQLLGASDPPAADGWSFTIARRYVSRAQAGAFQAMLDRLQALNLIAWQRYPEEIEVTVASDAARAIAAGL
jgi:soluble lytic murein transglycosylase-like protein